MTACAKAQHERAAVHRSVLTRTFSGHGMNSPLTVATARRALAAVAWASASGSPASMATAVKLRIMLGDLVAAVVSSFIVAPLTQIVDVAVSRSASGQASVLQGLTEGIREWVTQPFTKLTQPAFKLCWFVYICTYAGANMIEDICVLFLNISPVMPKFLGVTLCNMLACMYKDAKLAQLYGKSADAKPFPTVGYLLFLVRDLLANGGGFTFPPMVEPLLRPLLGAKSALVAQLGVPAAINIISSPIHFLALDIYNNPEVCALFCTAWTQANVDRPMATCSGELRAARQ